MSSLLLPLLQLVKTGFTKAAQRLDGIYALFCVVKIAAVDVKAGAYLSGFCFVRCFIADTLWLHNSFLLSNISCFSHLSFPLDETISKEKIWQLILQNEPTIIPISLVSTQFTIVIYYKISNLL